VTIVVDASNQSFDIGPLDPADPVPLYQQLRDQLRQQLGEGWPQDRPIPSERSLMQMTGLSRMTVRQAIAELVNDGVLRRDHGRGTFVADARVVRSLTGGSIFRDSIKRMGRKPGTRVIRQETSAANPAQAVLLHIEPGEPVLNLDRVRLVDELPVAVAFVTVPLRICPDIVNADLSGSLYTYLTTICGVRPDHSTATIEAVVADSEMARLLEVPVGSPLLRIQRLTLTSDDLQIELTDEFIRTDRCICLVDSPTGYVSANLFASLTLDEKDTHE